jgi:hypothetical protein
MDVLDREATVARLGERLLAARNADGGWPYAPGKRSRLEPTCWALLAAVDSRPAGAATLLARWPVDGARLIDGPQLPPNNVFNALAAILLRHDGADGERLARPIVEALVASKGIATGPSNIVIQDNGLQAWGWIDATTSWLEPTAWCVLLLKQLRRRGGADAAVTERIDTGDRMLLDRACRDGGWNYGNSIVYGKELWPYALTTALALIALQDRRDHPVVRQAVFRLERDAHQEASAAALALAILCRRVYGLPVDRLEERLVNVLANDESSGGLNILSLAMALAALGTSTINLLTV